jgi:hypothetical protein
MCDAFRSQYETIAATQPATHQSTQAQHFEMDAVFAAARAASDLWPCRCWLAVLRRILTRLILSVSTALSHWMKFMVLYGASAMAKRMAETVSNENCSRTLA